MNATPAPPTHRSTLLLCAAVVLPATCALLVHGPIHQDPAYHRFADARTLFGIPNFWNVVSNLPFVIAGAIGLRSLLHGPRSGVLPELRSAYAALFAGSVLVGFGSGWYHLAPADASLVWDRLPMTLAFMGFFVIVLGEHVSPALARRSLWPLVLLGAASVAWWRISGDLRAYVLVQFAPMLLIPALLLLHRSRLATSRPLWLVLASYAIAKLLELCDAPLYALTGVSGHPLKHVAAAAGLFAMLAAMQRAP